MTYVNDTLILASYLRSAREKLEFDSVIVKAELEISNEPNSSIPIPGSSRLTSLTSFLLF